MTTGPLRVLHLISHLGRGGTERQLALMLQHLEWSRVTSTVAVTSSSPNALWDESLRAGGVEVLQLSHLSPGRRLLALARAIDGRSIDLVHSWTLHLNGFAAVASRLAGCPVVGSLRGSLSSSGWRRLPRLYRWLCLFGVRRMLVNAVALRNELCAVGVDSARISTLVNAVSLPRTLATPSDCRKALGLAPDVPVVGSLGNLRQIKNHELFIEAMASVRKLHPNVLGLIVGQALASEPHTPDLLRQRIASLGLEDGVRLMGFRENAAELIPAFDVLVLTSHSEGMPNAVLEAMAAARPVVAVRVGGIPELVRHDVSGCIVDPGDAPGVARALTELLADPDRAARMGREGRRWAMEQHDPSRIAIEFARVYEGVAS